MIEKLTIFMPENFQEAMIVQNREIINEIIEDNILHRKHLDDSLTMLLRRIEKLEDAQSPQTKQENSNAL